MSERDVVGDVLTGKNGRAMGEIFDIHSRRDAAVLVMVVVMVLVGCEEPLQHDLDEGDANAMVVALTQQGFDAEKVRDPSDAERWAVEVPAAQRVEAWATLQQEGFPRPEMGGFDDFYPGGGLIPTAKEERVVLQYATARELQTSLLRVDGIIDAHVHLVLPERPRVQMTGDKESRPRASVLVQWTERAGEPPLDEESVRQLVSGAVEDLEPASVHVVMNPVAAPEPIRTEAEFAQVGPISVAPESQNTLRVVVLVMGVVIIALCSGLVFVVMRQRRREGQGGRS